MGKSTFWNILYLTHLVVLYKKHCLKAIFHIRYVLYIQIKILCTPCQKLYYLIKYVIHIPVSYTHLDVYKRQAAISQDLGVIAMAISFVVTPLVSVFTKKIDASYIDGVFSCIKK